MDLMPNNGPVSPDMAAGAAPDDQGSGAEDYSQGFVIEITVKPDGTITVGVEPSAEESGEDQGAGADGNEQEGSAESGDQPVQNWQEAMQVASDLYKNKGQLPSGSAGVRRQLYDQAPNQKP